MKGRYVLFDRHKSLLVMLMLEIKWSFVILNFLVFCDMQPTNPPLPPIVPDPYCVHSVLMCQVTGVFSPCILFLNGISVFESNFLQDVFYSGLILINSQRAVLLLIACQSSVLVCIIFK